MAAPSKYYSLRAPDSAGGSVRRVSVEDIPTALAYGWSPAEPFDSQAPEAMVYTRSDSGGYQTSYVPYETAAEYADTHQIAGMDKANVGYSSREGSTSQEDISRSDFRAGAGYLLPTVAEMPIEGGTPDDIQSGISDVEGADYLEDPLVAEAKRVHEELRSRQMGGLQQLADTTLGQATAAESRGQMVNSELGQAVAGAINTSQGRAALRGLGRATASAADQTMSDAGKQRAAQTQALMGGFAGVQQGDLRTSKLNTQRNLNRLSYDVARQGQVSDWLNLANQVQASRQNAAVRDVGLDQQMALGNVTGATTVPTQDYASRYASAGLSGLSTGLGMAGDIYANSQRQPDGLASLYGSGGRGDASISSAISEMVDSYDAGARTDPVKTYLDLNRRQ